MPARPASVYGNGANHRNGQDPARKIDGMPPNFGQDVLPHVITFQGIISSVARVYRPSDEAIKDSYENARFMRNDCGLMECIEQRQRSSALLNWHLEPENPKDPKQQWLAEDLTAVLEQTPRFMQFRENLLHALWFGRYAVSNRYRWKNVYGRGQRLCIDRWRPVNGDKIVFRYDDGSGQFDDDQIGIRVGAGFATGEQVAKRWTVERLKNVEATDYGLAYFLEPWERSLLAIHKHQIEDGEYEDPRSAGKIHGVGIRSRIYWSWFQMQETLAWLMEYLERSAFGVEIWYYPWGNPEAEAKTRQAAEERIGQGRNIVLVPRPLGEQTHAYGVERIEPGMAGADACQRIITEYFGHKIKRYILGQTLTTEAGSTGLGSNLADIHLAGYLQIIKYDSTNLEETLTEEVVKPLQQANYPKYRDVPLRFRIDTEAPDVESKLQAWRQAWDMGVKLKAQEVMDLIGASKPDQTDEILANPQVAQANMQLQQMQAEQEAGQQQQQRQATQHAVARSANAKRVYRELQVRRLMDALGVEEEPGTDGAAADGPRYDRQQIAEGLRRELDNTRDPAIALQAVLNRLGENPEFYGQATPSSEDSPRRKLETYAKFSEADHPRDDDGQFAEKGGSGKPASGKIPPRPKLLTDRSIFNEIVRDYRRGRMTAEEVEHDLRHEVPAGDFVRSSSSERLWNWAERYIATDDEDDDWEDREWSDVVVAEGNRIREELIKEFREKHKGQPIAESDDDAERYARRKR